MKKFLKWTFIVSTGLIVFLVGLAWVLVAIYRDDIRLRAEQAIDKQVNALVTFDDLSVSLLKDFPNVTVTLHDLLVIGKGEFSSDTLARADELDLELKSISLLSGKEIELKSIYLHSPDLFLKVLKNGKANYDIFLSRTEQKQTSAPGSHPVNVALDEIKISDGIVEYHDPSAEIFALMRDLNHTGSGDLLNDLFDFTTKTTVGEFTLDYQKVRFFSKKEVEIDMILQMNVKEKSFTLKENKFRVNHFTLGLEGSFALLEKGYDLDLSFNTQATDFKNIVSLVPGIFMKDFKQISTEGSLGFKGFVIGQYLPDSGQLPSLLADIKINDGKFKIDTLPDPIENIQLEMIVKNMNGVKDSTTFDVKNFQFDMRKHPVKGRLKIQGLDHYKLDMDIMADVDLAELERMYPIHGLELKGKVDFELTAKGPLIFAGTSLQVSPSYHLDMKLGNGKVKYDHLPAAIDSIQFHLVADNKTGKLEESVIDFRTLHLDLDDNRVHGFMKLEGYENLKITTDLKADLDLADLERLWPITGTVMKGNLSLDVEAEGIYNKSKKKFPSVDAKLELVNGYLQTTGYPEPIKSIHFSGEAVNKTGNYADTRIAINRLTYTLEEEPFEINGSISDLENYDYDLKVKGLVDLEKITKIYPVEGMTIKGTIYSDVETRGRLTNVETGHYENVSSNGRVEIKNLTMEGPAISHHMEIKDAAFTFTPTKIILEKLVGKFGKSGVSLSGDLFNYMAFATRKDDLVKCDLDLKCDTLDLNEWLSQDKPATTTSTTSASKIAVWQVPLNVDLVFDSEIEHVIYEDIKISKLDGEIRMKEGVLTLNETGFNTLDAKFSLSGDYNTKDINHPTFDADLDIKELDINKAYREMKIVRTLLPATGNADGIFSITYKLKGEFAPDFSPKYETLAGGGEIRIAHAKINGMKIFEELSKAAKKQEVNDPHLKDFVMRSEIRDNKIIVKPFSIKVSGFDADVEGVSEISGAIRYLVKLELLPFKVKIPFHVTGTYDNPKVAMGKGHVLFSSDSLSN